MPRLTDILDRVYLRVFHRIRASDEELRSVERQVERKNDFVKRDFQTLLHIIREKDELIRRLKATDEKRNAVFLRNMIKWRKKQAEVRKIRAKNRTLRRLLRSRRGKLREQGQRLRDSNRVVHQLNRFSAAAVFAGEEIPADFDASPGRNIRDRWMRYLADLGDWPWTHWMKLGRYFQYDPRPLMVDELPESRISPEKAPKISIVTPSYQQAEYLEATLKSVVDQDYPNLEYIVMDGGSNDGSVQILKDYSSKITEWESGPDGGQSAAIKSGFGKTSGEIMAWLNSDDLIFPGTLEFVADYFAKHPDVDVVYGHRIILDENGFETGRWILPQHDPELLAWADFIPQECTFWRREIYEKVGGMDPEFQFAMDWDLFLRFQQAGAKFVRLPWFMGGFRVHPEQKNAVTIATDGFSEMNKLRKKYLGELYQKGSLHKRVNWFQARAVVTAVLWRMGIRR